MIWRRTQTHGQSRSTKPNPSMETRGTTLPLLQRHASVGEKVMHRSIPIGIKSSILIAFAACATSNAMAKSAPTFDLLIKGGTVYNGSGAKPFVGDVAVKGDKIIYVGPRAKGTARKVINARGKAVAPGFINAMSWATTSLLTDPLADSDLRQGVTLEIMGEGTSPGPLNATMAEEASRDPAIPAGFTWRTLGEYLEGVEKRGTAVNFAAWVGAATVRTHVLGTAEVVPTPMQLSEMRMLVRQAMEEGALGLSTALIYIPGLYASTDELTALTSEVGKCGGMYVSHLRSEGDKFLEAVDELIEIARRSGAPAEIFHIKAGGRPNWPKMAVVLARIRAAREAGIRITANMYPYAPSGTLLTASMPPWAREGGMDAFRTQLKNPDFRARVISEMRASSTPWENVMRLAGGPDGVMMAAFAKPELRTLVGKTLTEVAALRGVSAEEAALQLVEEDDSEVEAFYFTVSEDNLRLQIKEPYISFGSDGAALSITPAILTAGNHPRVFGAFARVFAKYVRDEKLLTVEEAVRRLTSLPAANYALRDRGWLKPGFYADVVVFDPATIQDRATYTQPNQYATGVSDVVVNGVHALAYGEPTNARPGKFVRGRAWSGYADGGCRATAAEWPWPR